MIQIYFQSTFSFGDMNDVLSRVFSNVLVLFLRKGRHTSPCERENVCHSCPALPTQNIKLISTTKTTCKNQTISLINPLTLNNYEKKKYVSNNIILAVFCLLRCFMYLLRTSTIMSFYLKLTGEERVTETYY